jgi:hypothetical protein
MVQNQERRPCEHNAERRIKVIYILYLPLPARKTVNLVYKKIGNTILYCMFCKVKETMAGKPYVVKRNIKGL